MLLLPKDFNLALEVDVLVFELVHLLILLLDVLLEELDLILELVRQVLLGVF